MRIAVFSTKPCDALFLGRAAPVHAHDLAFFEDLSDEIIQDDVFQRLLTFPNLPIIGHQAFFTEEAPTAIAEEEAGRASANRVAAEGVRGRG